MRQGAASMFFGLKNKRTAETGAYSASSGQRSPALDKELDANAKNRKKFLSMFCWYHEKVKSRQEAESKLKQSAGQSQLSPSDEISFTSLL